MNKLDVLVESEDYSDEWEFMEAFALDSIVPGICMNPGCDYTTDVEPDQRRGWCEECETQSVESGISLMGII